MEPTDDAGRAASGRTGRRPGKPDTRAHILRVAGEVFRREGFADTSVRGIAREAGVDPALVHRYFGTKRELFLAAFWLGLDVTKLPAQVAAGGRDGLGVRFMATITALWETPIAAHMIAALHARPALLGEIPRYLNDSIVDAVESLGHSRREAELRAALVESQVLGLAQARLLLGLQPVASMTRDQLVRVYAPIMQHVLTGDLGVLVPAGKSSPGRRTPPAAHPQG